MPHTCTKGVQYHCSTKETLDTVVTCSGNKLTNAKLCLKIHQRFIYNKVESSRREKERKYQNMRRLQLHKIKQHILVRKRLADIDLEFFSYF